jgi:5'-3' exonuclease
MPDAPRLVLMDGSASLYRAFFALPALTNSRGTPTNAVLGFATILLKLLREEEPAAAAAVFDGPGPTTRHREFPAYKAQRPSMPERLVEQIPLIHRLLAAMRIPLLMVVGEEADDILATIAAKAASQGYLVRLVTGDKDLLQVVGERIVVRDPMAPRTLGPAEVEGRYGISPAQVPDLLGLMGDSSDNIPGVPGVGEKTARDLLQRFGSLEAVLDHATEVARPKLREALVTHGEQARFSKRLATVRTDLPVPWTIADLARQEPDVPALLALFRELEFTRLIQQFEQPTLSAMTNDGISKANDQTQ